VGLVTLKVSYYHSGAVETRSYEGDDRIQSGLSLRSGGMGARRSHNREIILDVLNLILNLQKKANTCLISMSRIARIPERKTRRNPSKLAMKCGN